MSYVGTIQYTYASVGNYVAHRVHKLCETSFRIFKCLNRLGIHVFVKPFSMKVVREYTNKERSLGCTEFISYIS